jgi:hypothetical protein
MTHRWQISFDDGGSWSDTTPLNDGKLKIQRKRDLDAGQIFFRKYINQGILFGKADFPQFLAIERQSSRRCDTILVRLQLKCNNVFQEDWRGKFSTGSGTFNLFECTFEVKPDTVDKYSCVLENQDLKANALLQGYVTVHAATMPTIRFGMSVFDGFADPDPVYRTYNVILDSDGNPTDPGWELNGYEYEVPVGALTYHYKLWWREEIFTDCIDGVAQVPAGTGWTLVTDFCGVEGPFFGKAFYVRTPQFSYSITSLVAGTCPDTPPAESFCPNGQLIEAQPCDFALENYPVLESGAHRLPLYVCFNGVVQDFTRARTMESVLDQLFTTMGCGTPGAHSDFFNIDPLGNSPGYIEGQNYVTGETSQTDHILFLQKSDALSPSATNHATIGELTFKELMAMLRSAFRVYWDINDAGYLILEHYHFWTFALGTNLTTADGVIEPLVYSHLSDQIPRIERLSFMEAVGRDFIGKDLIYSGPCVIGDTTEEISAGKYTTDLPGILVDPTQFSKDGFAIVATTYDGSIYNAIIDTGVLSGDPVLNAPLSTANLMRDYWTWDRYLPNGNMNGEDVEFDGFVPNIEQKAVSFSICCDELRFIAAKGITTTLGHMLGDIVAVVEDYEFDIKTCRAKITLRYAY